MSLWEHVHLGMPHTTVVRFQADSDETVMTPDVMLPKTDAQHIQADVTALCFLGEACCECGSLTPAASS